MKYNDASSLEERNENNLYEIHFYFEGDWWRAYEWSAYLATHYKTSEVSSLVPTKKSWSGNEDGIVLVGLKTQSFKKYFPELDVEDFYVVSKDKKFLKEIVKEITVFMKEKLNLDIQEKKTHIINVKQGIDFLGAFIKAYRTYLSNKSIRRIRRDLYNFQHHKPKKNVVNMVNSYLGSFSHWKSNNIKIELFSKIGKLNNYGHFKDNGYRKFVEI